MMKMRCALLSPISKVLKCGLRGRVGEVRRTGSSTEKGRWGKGGGWTGGAGRKKETFWRLLCFLAGSNRADVMQTNSAHPDLKKGN
jgi:hypothetical protein